MADRKSAPGRKAQKGNATEDQDAREGVGGTWTHEHTHANGTHTNVTRRERLLDHVFGPACN